ncbi:Murein DD-endopeptidase MepM and murein hydrolase activator NlpD, contain LysM domain [Salegentibacter echinorum]|uniref:Murein DD-endopeptidase MepM and murein hydrolase activator NlpD, contain LysM domain n=1 Tax=Salegentibacter echinorum TaxID=1073325 RepID=A0A1M5G9C0_SALEC|nr:M23 family metallopeptidase [Salegentibacter echinorum]SHG00062.1 Murein DD-endopeptidase MepM and murein hydrolase activator NlpD, contain LysM domain [Salegentibacter echinorum]
MKQLKTLSLLFTLIICGCSHLDKASDFITNPTAKEQYKRNFNISNELFEIWENSAKTAFQDSVSVTLPYAETGKFFPKSFPVYSYEIHLQPGEVLDLSIKTDSVNQLIFAELFEKTNDSIPEFKKVTGTDFQKKNLKFEAEKSATYKLVIQPEIEAHTRFVIEIEKKPAYLFPVSGANNANIQSYWGANRDGGARSHEGIDIFARRGTPVLAATDGRIGFTGEKGLGGKQVWLRDRKRRQLLYYAHLDSIANVSGNVKRGDTLGFVGNTGNAKTTAPHLHFGIYKGYGGAINPLYFVYKTEKSETNQSISEITALHLIVGSSKANLRNRPTTAGSVILNTAKAGDTLQLLGKSKNWFHIRTSNNQASFIHESLVRFQNPLSQESIN